MRNRILEACSVVCVSVFSASGAFAQCGSGYTDLDTVLAQSSVAMVFTGTVASVARTGSTEAVTFDVDRIWKGPVHSRTTIYRPIPVRKASDRDFNPPVFDRGTRYVVTAHRLSAVERSNMDLAGSAEAFGTDGCADHSRLFAVAGPDLVRLGPGRAPIDQRPLVRGVHVATPLKIKDAAPVYPKAALDVGVRGTVIVEFAVDERGKVTDARVLRSIPLLDQAAMDSVRKWEYLPALINGVPRRVVLTAAVNFEP